MINAAIRGGSAMKKENIVRWSFESSDYSDSMEVSLDRRCRWMHFRLSAWPEEFHKPEYSWTFPLDDALWSRFTKILDRHKPLDWEPGLHHQYMILNPIEWEMKAETSDNNRNWGGNNYPESFWDFYEDLERFCTDMYSKIAPPSDFHGISLRFGCNPERSVIMNSCGLIVDDGLGGRTVCGTTPEDLFAMSEILSRYDTSPRFQEPVRYEKGGYLVSLTADCGIQGTYELLWGEERPEYVDRLCEEIWDLAKRISSEDGRAGPSENEVILGRRDGIVTVSCSTVRIVEEAASRCKVRFPMDDKGFSYVWRTIEEARTRADRAQAVGAQVDEKLARNLRTACEELRQLSDRRLNMETINALLQSDNRV